MPGLPFATAPSRATQAMSGALLLLDQHRRRLAAPARPPRPCARRCRRCGSCRWRRCAPRRAIAGDARRDQRAAAGAEHLQIDVLVPRVDRDRERDRVVGGDVGRGEGRERGEAERRLAGRERDAARRRDADAQAGEAARARSSRRCGRARRTAVVGLAHHAGDQRHQRFGVAARHRHAIRSPARRCSVSSTAAEQASSAVSMASTRMADYRCYHRHGRRLSRPSTAIGRHVPCKTRCPASSPGMTTRWHGASRLTSAGLRPRRARSA